ncbi:B12-binding domain-containing radical SAM protein [bacterium]|nr:B12-binding domain-containing radical SAM protein [bacterium]
MQNKKHTFKKIVLVNGNETQLPYRVAPLGLAFVASTLKERGHHVLFIDTPTSQKDFRKLEKEIMSFSPDYLAMGIRNLDNSDFHQYHSYLELPKKIVSIMKALDKKMQKKTPILLGGSAVTVDPDSILKWVGGDHLLIGEGENSILQFLEEAELQKPATIYKDQKQAFRVKDTHALKKPSLYEWVDVKKYLKGDAGYPIQSKRGCPLKCSYCTYASIEGKSYRFLDANQIADEIEGAIEKGVREFEFVDSTFNLPPRHCINILKTIQKRGIKTRFVGSGIHPAFLNEELLSLMQDLGFSDFILTAESASETMLASYQKGFAKQKLYQAAELLKKYDFRVMWVFLLGGPSESKETVEETLSFIRDHISKKDAIYITSGIRIYPGSPIETQLKQGKFEASDIHSPNGDETQFFYSHLTPPSWLESRLREFQKTQSNVMLSCEGHSKWTSLALKILPFTGLSKPYWKYIPVLNTIKKLLKVS